MLWSPTTFPNLLIIFFNPQTLKASLWQHDAGFYSVIAPQLLAFFISGIILIFAFEKSWSVYIILI